MSERPDNDMGAGTDKELKARNAALDAAKSQIEKQFGAGSLMKLGDQGALNVESISTAGKWCE